MTPLIAHCRATRTLHINSRAVPCVFVCLCVCAVCAVCRISGTLKLNVSVSTVSVSVSVSGSAVILPGVGVHIQHTDDVDRAPFITTSVYLYNATTC